MSSWKIIVPEATRNMVLNPSAETTGNYTQLPGAIVSRSNAYMFRGDFSYQVAVTADNEGISFTLGTLGGTNYWVTLWARVTITGFDSTDWDWSLDNINYFRPDALLDFEYGDEVDAWALFGYEFSSSHIAGDTLYIRQNGAGSSTWYIDAVQVEYNTTTGLWTSYCDGGEDGCEWEGTAHASASRRSPAARSGGTIYDLEDDYDFNIGGMLGVGAAPHELATQSYALLPGGEASHDKLGLRNFALSGSILGTSTADYHNKRADLLAILTTEVVAASIRGPQPLRLIYTGNDLPVYIDAFYTGGLELRLAATDPCYFERNIALRFLATDPLWYRMDEASKSLGTSSALTVRCIAGRIYSGRDPGSDGGRWDNLSVGAITAGAGGNTIVHTIVRGPDNKIYVGGDFTVMDGVPNTNHVAVYDPVADTWAALSTGLNDVVYALAFGPDGTLYAGGEFTAGAANADYLAQWNGAAWVAVGGAGTRNGAVRAIIFDADGNLIIGGDFTDWVAGPRLDYVAQWDGTNWDYLFLDELDNDVYALALAPNGDVYIGGKFTKMNAVNNSRNYICRWDGTTSHQLGTSNSATGNGTSGYVYAIAIDRAGAVYLGGDFSTAMGDTMNNIAKWNGTMFEALGNGVGDIVWALTFGPDDTLWVGGVFNSMGDLSWVDQLARWKDNSWAAVDVNLPAGPTVYAIATGAAGSVIAANYDVWVGFNTTGTANIATANIITMTGSGTWRKFPLLYVERSGGTQAQIVSFRHTGSGDELIFDYGLLDGERLTIDLAQTQKGVVSSFFGNRPSALLPNSDFGSFRLPSERTANIVIHAFVRVLGAPTISTYIRYKYAQESIDLTTLAA